MDEKIKTCNHCGVLFDRSIRTIYKNPLKVIFFYVCPVCKKEVVCD